MMTIFCNLLFKRRKRKRKCCSHFEVFGVLHGTVRLLFIRVGWDVSVGVLVKIFICIGVTCCRLHTLMGCNHWFYLIIFTFSVGFKYSEETNCHNWVVASMLEWAPCCSSGIIQSSSFFWIDNLCDPNSSRFWYWLFVLLFIINYLFVGLTCLFISDERKEIEKLITQNGGKYSAELTKKCTHLICDISLSCFLERNALVLNCLNICFYQRDSNKVHFSILLAKHWCSLTGWQHKFILSFCCVFHILHTISLCPFGSSVYKNLYIRAFPELAKVSPDYFPF